MSRVYPRLALSHALEAAKAVRELFAEGGSSALSHAAAFSHPHAAPVATGGRVATPQEIERAREEVLEAMAPLLDRREVPTVKFDVVLGKSLHEALDIVPGDAAHDETWSFLSLVVFPDLVARRFPDLHDDRLLGKPRNALRRVWQRAEVLGDLLHVHPRPLGEDEAVGLFERTALARNRRLVRAAACEVMNRVGGTARSEWAREFYKRLQYLTGPYLLDTLTDDELNEVIKNAASAADVAFDDAG